MIVKNYSHTKRFIYICSINISTVVTENDNIIGLTNRSLSVSRENAIFLFGNNTWSTKIKQHNSNALLKATPLNVERFELTVFHSQPKKIYKLYTKQHSSTRPAAIKHRLIFARGAKRGVRVLASTFISIEHKRFCILSQENQFFLI